MPILDWFNTVPLPLIWNHHTLRIKWFHRIAHGPVFLLCCQSGRVSCSKKWDSLRSMSHCSTSSVDWVCFVPAWKLDVKLCSWISARNTAACTNRLWFRNAVCCLFYTFPLKSDRGQSSFIWYFLRPSWHQFNKHEKGCELNVLCHSNDDRIVLSKGLNC